MSCLRVQCRRGFSHQRRTKGVATTAPTASPSHHVVQIEPYTAQSANPAKARVVTPMVALTVVLGKAASAMPVQGQTAVALALTKASFKPSLPATKYAAARTASAPSSFRNRERTTGLYNSEGGR